MNQTPSPLPRIAIVASSWHADIVDNAVASATEELVRCGVPAERIDVFRVAGAFEIPLQARRVARKGRYDAVIACGLVVNGGIYRHEFVASAVIDGLMQVQLDTDVPVLSCVLTPRDFHEHPDHVAFFQAHMRKKGVEVAGACLRTLQNLQALEASAA